LAVEGPREIGWQGEVQMSAEVGLEEVTGVNAADEAGYAVAEGTVRICGQRKRGKLRLP
jgi:hypothetical protein